MNTSAFGAELYRPVSALVFYRADQIKESAYVQAYQIDKNGFPINAHPLTIQESAAYADLLQVNTGRKHNFLSPVDILPKGLLYLQTGRTGQAIWATPAQRVQLHFVESLGIPSGLVHIPPLIWKASASNLQVFAYKKFSSVRSKTNLYQAPFFNLYDSGQVCMGTVQVRFPLDCHLDYFMSHWQEMFFNSYFAQLITNREPIEGMVELWKQLQASEDKFPIHRLKANGLTLKNLLP